MSSTDATGFGYAPRMLDDLDDAIKGHKPYPKSLLDEESTEAYNEEEARGAFGDEFIDQLKKVQGKFKGDWWQLALLVRNLEEDKQDPDIKDEDRLGAWNKWRHAGDHARYGYVHLEHAILVYAHLEHAKLDTAHLEHANLCNAHLEHARLVGAHLEHANLEDAHLEHARLVGALLEHAKLLEAHLKHADLEHAHLEQAGLWHAHLEDAYLASAHLKHAKLGGAHLEQADLEDAHLEHADLEDGHLGYADLRRAHLEHAILFSAHLEHADLEKAHLEHAELAQANLNGADVRGATGLRFDGNRVEGIHIEGNAPDPWSVLRRKYTGPRFFVHLLLLAVFFAPYIGHALYLTGKSQFQEWSVEQYDAVGDRVANLPGVREYHTELERRFFDEHVHRPAIWVLLGLHRGVIPITLAAVVILYNALRGCLTLRISSLRDAEERSSITPTLEEYYGVCHPLTQERPVRMRNILRRWLDGHGKLRWLVLPQQMRRSRWVARWLPDRLTKAETPLSLMDCFGLYRLHQVASILFWAAVLAVVYNTLVWMVDTWIWVPVGS